MIRQFELVDKVREYNPNTDEALLNRAYVFGATAHANQRRASGEPYWGHPLEVASILTDLRLDDSTIVTALLHDTVEDTPATQDEIERLFGAEIAGLVDGVTKLTKLEVSSTETAQAENFRKLLLAMAKDVRVILVKLADRLHNMRTLDHLKPEKRRRIAQETMDIYAPLAGRMGMQSMREELEDLAFEVLNPEARTSLMRRFLKLTRDSGGIIPKITAELERTLSEAGIRAKVRGREKKPYSIWRKMEEKQISFSQLSDIYGFRVIVDAEDDCYHALGAIHRHWRAVPGRFKDYISGPKANGYRSIHTTVSGPGAARVEMQIRTSQMHAVAETGVAAHWAYRDGERVENPFAVDPYTWLRDLVARLESGNEPQEFLEHVKLDMFTDQVFCFTPKGEVVGLPRGATPIDFAYAIHTRIGERCAGALVDGRRVPLWTRLRNGQQVEIITAEGQRPSPHWEDMARTGRAKHAIRRALRDRQRDEEMALGRDLLEQSFARVGREGGAKACQAAAAKLGQPSVEALLIQIARGELATHQVVEAIYPAAAPAAPPPDTPADLRRVSGVSRNAAVVFCQTCLPVPGERIIGLARRGGVVVHEMSCPVLAQHEADLSRWHDLRWAPDAARTPANLARIELTLLNQPGTLGKVCTLVGEQSANIDNIGVTTRKPDFFLMTMDLEVRDLRHLNDILTSLKAQSFVNRVERARRTRDAEIEPPPHSVDQPRLPLGRDPAPGA
ncbi:MAG: bifunctional (p)ppGpp synthetase/guanosine-3',5'-bis(diphosphate) 3'-pyrophosphohydrolase [Thermohalobaculum sp.]|nr:bifunctional (p)ppGpp synthetase/guanosine-3',5'-bis(diphosphate) 3'-pyrophosphohydrolase [Thermohalobaculum sp.]